MVFSQDSWTASSGNLGGPSCLRDGRLLHEGESLQDVPQRCTTQRSTQVKLHKMKTEGTSHCRLSKLSPHVIFATNKHWVHFTHAFTALSSLPFNLENDRNPSMDFLKSAVSAAIAKSASFPYAIGDRVDNDDSIWTLHNGTKRVRTYTSLHMVPN